MAKKTKIEREIEKKVTRREEERKELADYFMSLDKAVAPKKPDEFNFDKENIESFEYPVAIGNTIIEKKSDGYCVHVAFDKKNKHETIKIYSSGGNLWNPECFPEIIKDLVKLPSGYYHGEILGINPGQNNNFKALDEYVAIQNRPKLSTKDLTSELLKKYPLKVDLFDILMLEKKLVLANSLRERRNILETEILQTKNLNLIKQWNVKNKEELNEIFQLALKNGYEGLVAKDPDSLYVPGSRNNDWLKIKPFTTLDLAVLGLYETPESKNSGKPFSAILVGSYNTDTNKFETMAKIKVGAKKDQDEIYVIIKDYLVETNEDYNTVVKANRCIAINPGMQKIKRKIPKSIINYNNGAGITIVELKFLDVTYSENWHSSGIAYDGKKAHSLRLPTFEQLRTDKTRISDVTTTEQVHNFYAGM